jgi:hypothetical protein
LYAILSAHKISHPPHFYEKATPAESIIATQPSQTIKQPVSVFLMNFGKGTLFPEKLHCMLEYAEDQGLHDVLSWTGNGLAFIVHEPDMLTMAILPIFFGATKYRSFVRQLSNWSFHRYTCNSACNNTTANKSNSSATIFEHPYFIRGEKSLCENLTRESFKRSSDDTSTAQISGFIRCRQQMNLANTNKTNTSKTAAAADAATALHVQTQNRGGRSINNDTSSPSSSSTNSQLSPPRPVATSMDTDPPPCVILLMTPCKSSDSIVASSSSIDAWAKLDTASLWASEDDDDDDDDIMTNFQDGDLIDFEGKQFHFLDLKRDV